MPILLGVGPAVAADGVAAWTPPPYGPPPLSAVTDPLVWLVAFLARHRFLMMPVLAVALPMFIGWRSSKAAQTGRPAVRHPLLMALCILFAILNVILGPWWAGSLVYHGGVSGAATVTAMRSTSSTYNEQRVQAYDVLIRAADGRLIEARFHSDDFNVYPSHNRTFYPGPGAVFTVRYLQHAPRTFVIVASDDSPWARRLRCGDLMNAVSTAGGKRDFAPDDARYRAAYAQALTEAQRSGCMHQP
ncbi:hypothetical protein [Sphingomonas sp.]|uniref:hypothetical protein n=1 Tax=Sphingomonas sp. TaxID=28214 RepID=UPI003B3B4BC2